MQIAEEIALQKIYTTTGLVTRCPNCGSGMIAPTRDEIWGCRKCGAHGVRPYVDKHPTRTETAAPKQRREPRYIDLNGTRYRYSASKTGGQVCCGCNRTIKPGEHYYAAYKRGRYLCRACARRVKDNDRD
jgi:ribosomal protein L37AE/L43A